jgi:hypothetical protein
MSARKRSMAYYIWQAELSKMAAARTAAPAPRDIPADRTRYPGGCPDPDWCRGNRACYWHCNGDEPGIPEESKE